MNKRNRCIGLRYLSHLAWGLHKRYVGIIDPSIASEANTCLLLSFRNSVTIFVTETLLGLQTRHVHVDTDADLGQCDIEVQEIHFENVSDSAVPLPIYSQRCADCYDLRLARLSS